MQIDKQQAVAFMAALGFSKAKDWTDDVLAERLGATPERVKPEEVPAPFVELYNSISDSPKTEPIELTGEGVAKKSKAAKPAGKFVENTEPEASTPSQDTQPELPMDKQTKSVKETTRKATPAPAKTTPKGSTKFAAAIVSKKLAAAVSKETTKIASLSGKTAKDKQPAKVTKDAAPKMAKPAAKPIKAKSAKPAREKTPLDSYGCREGTISSDVNLVMTNDWQDDVAIAKAAKCTLREARGRLYLAVVNKVFEAKRIIQYRLMPKKAGK
jgi:hypothetical protein